MPQVLELIIWKNAIKADQRFWKSLPIVCQMLQSYGYFYSFYLVLLLVIGRLSLSVFTKNS